MVPRSDFEILDNWYVAGLCGSGSKDLEVKDEFVPTDRTLDPERTGNGDFTGWELHQQARYRVPLRCLLGWDILSPRRAH